MALGTVRQLTGVGEEPDGFTVTSATGATEAITTSPKNGAECPPHEGRIWVESRGPCRVGVLVGRDLNILFPQTWFP